eukprot:TRINITY_DN4298_c0_g1_i1.p1 TRINITY_DN4298_c0_g1~~TRINITY_DN4298_c0_g1_i1.p1  ORF type:complete len:303 (+),score=100.22 TRINITY_DN4298_c0_g1_i1:55-963(+)
MGNTSSSAEVTTKENEGVEDIEESNTCDSSSCSTPCEFNPNLVGTVKIFKRAIMVCSGKQDWASKLKREDGSFSQKLLEALSDPSFGIEESEMPLVAATSEPCSGVGTDIYIFPDQLKYTGLQEKDIPTIINEHIINNRPASSLSPSSVSGSVYMYVCTHAAKDKRCGRIGPQVLSKLQQLVETHNVQDKVHVYASSHVGGHKYAGVVVAFPRGDYYGYVSGRNISTLFEEYINNPDNFATTSTLSPEHLQAPSSSTLWRGRMGMGKEQQKALAQAVGTIGSSPALSESLSSLSSSSATISN